MKKIYILQLLVPFIFFSSFSQNNLIQWQKSYGGSSYDGAYQIKQTSDGGYIVCGYSWSANGDVKGHHGTNGWYPDGWVMKLKANGDTSWTRSLGGTWDDYANAIIETDDGNFVVALQSQSNDGDVSVNKGGWDYWIVKLDASGSILWEKSYGGSASDYAYSLVQANDGHYVVAGYSNSTAGDITGNKGGDDFWIIKVDENNGAIIWKKNYGGSDYDEAIFIAKTSDQGFVVAGYSSSSDGDLTSNQGYEDYWVLKLDSTGNKQWQKSMGGNYYDDANYIEQTSDGGYIVAGASASNSGTGDVTTNFGSWDYWVVKLNSNGTQIEWEKSYGGTAQDLAYSIVQTSDNGYMLGGFSESNDNDVSGNHGNKDYWAAKLDNSGNIQWSSTFGGDSLEYCFSVIQTNDGGYALAGLTRSYNEDVTTNKGQVDLWIVKTFCTPPVIPDICLVTVDSSSTKNLIVWEKPAVAGIDSFRIYRDIVGNYTYLGSVAYSDLGKFVDNTMGVNPQVTSYKYKISSVDTCGNESPMSEYHKTIHLQVNGNNLTWDNYSGFNTSFFYRILRDTLNSGNLFVLDSLTNSNFTWTDLIPPVLNNATYVIEVVHPFGGCTVTKSVENHNSSRSNRGYAAPPGSLPVAEFTVSSVNIAVGGTVNFSDQTTNNPTNWNWTFQGGNPTSSAQQNPQNISYNNSGCFEVKLVASNNNGSDSIIKTCYINVTTGGSAPVADFTATAINISPGDSINFFDLSLNGPYQWQWIFTNGNPSVSTQQHPQNIKYNTSGCFDVTLIATNGNGSNSKTKTCYVSVFPVGVNDDIEEGDKLIVYPNPAGEKLFIYSPDKIERISINNLLGMSIYQRYLSNTDGNTISMDISGISGGIYFISVRSGGKTEITKMVVK